LELWSRAAALSILSSSDGWISAGIASEFFSKLEGGVDPPMHFSQRGSRTSLFYSGRMGKGAPLRWLENRLLAEHLRGRGIEIGALWRKFPIPRGATVYYVDRLPDEDLRQHYSEVSTRVVNPDVVADAMQLPFAPRSLDFVIASHVLEHLPFPLAALRHWYDVLRPRGVLLLKIPDKRYTFDAKRARTTLQHLIAEDADGSRFDKRAHFEDWVENVVGCRRATPEFDQQLAQLLQSDYSIHYHVWIDEDIREIVEYARSVMRLNWCAVVFWKAHVYRKECVLMLQRTEAD
jgi:predicted SAM-dependent methyltransferase